MTTLEKLQLKASEPGRLSRRTLVGRVVKLSAAVAATAAGAAKFTDVAYAGNYGCCNLVWVDNFCNSDYYSGQCPSGCGTPYEWTCTAGSCLYYCGECYDCACSYGYFIPCSPGCACSPELAPLAKTITARQGAKSLYVPHRKRGERCHP